MGLFIHGINSHKFVEKHLSFFFTIFSRYICESWIQKVINTGELNCSPQGRKFHLVLFFLPPRSSLWLYNFHCFIKENSFSVSVSATCPITDSLDFTMIAFLLYLIVCFKKIEVRSSRVTRSSYIKWPHTSSYQCENFYRNSSFKLLTRVHNSLN